MESMILERSVAEPKDISVRLRLSMVRDARIAADIEGKSLGEYISDEMEIIVKKRLDRWAAERAKAEKRPKGDA